jgi:hypothetical protein
MLRRSARLGDIATSPYSESDRITLILSLYGKKSTGEFSNDRPKGESNHKLALSGGKFPQL